jgi:prolyl-tRNA synthetase
VIGERGLKDGSIEIKWRHESAPRNLPLTSGGEGILAELAAARAELAVSCQERIAARNEAKTPMGEQP